MSASKTNVISNKLHALFPIDLAKRLYIEQDSKWARENSNKTLSLELVAELHVNEICSLAISQWQILMHIINSAIGGPVVLTDMLIPVEEKISVFNIEMAKRFAGWDEALDQAYCQIFGANSEQGKQLVKAFMANLRAEIKKTGILYVTNKLVITKCASRYILENKTT